MTAYIPSCRFLYYESDNKIFVTPQLSNLAKLSAIHLSGSISGYEAIGTFPAPDLQELVLCFDNTFYEQPLPDPILPLFNTGTLLGLTKLDIASFAQFRQVDALPLHLISETESTLKGNLVICAVPMFATSPFYNGKKIVANSCDLEGC